MKGGIRPADTGQGDFYEIFYIIGSAGRKARPADHELVRLI